MELNKHTVIEMVEDALKNLLDDSEEISSEINAETLLLAEGSSIDSLTLVSLVVDLEAKLSEDYNLDISLTDDKAMTREVSPFYNVESLSNYILELQETGNSSS